MQEIIKTVNDAVNNVVWGVPMLLLLIGTGLFLTIVCRFVQIRHFGYAMKNTLGKIFKKSEAGSGEVTPFQAVTTALAATVGTGNISGIIFAITLGGPGAIFWLWIAALIGMCTKYAEVVLSVKFRERNEQGDWVGGPMYYITNGLGKKWKWLACIFSIFGALAAFGIGNAVQVGNITDAIKSAIVVFTPSAKIGRADLIIGIIVAIIVGVTLIGGVKRLGSVTEKLVPFMSAIYIIACLALVVCRIGDIGHVFASIFKYAFTPNAIIGGGAGAAIKTCITWGVKRGVFSNEAGLGSAPIAHAATSETDPVKQGLYGIFEVFMDSIVICTLTGVSILIALPDEVINYGVKGGNDLIIAAFGTVFGSKIAALIIAVGITLFALSTVLSWGHYGARCCEYLFGKNSVVVYKVLFVAVVVISATIDLGLAWEIADTLNGLMAIPNLIGLIGLSGVVIKLTKEHFANKSLK